MRVISGKAKGRKLISVPGDGTRPILDRVKTSLFDILRPTLADAEILDLFAGSGGVGIEALSQGAGSVVFLDVSKEAIETIERNLALTGLRAQAEVRKKDAFGYLRSAQKSFDIIYVAPPQFKAMWIEAVHHIAERPELLKREGRVIVQIHPDEYEDLSLRSLQETDQRKYGKTLLIFFERMDESGEAD